LFPQIQDAAALLDLKVLHEKIPRFHEVALLDSGTFQEKMS